MPLLHEYHDLKGRRIQLTISAHPNGDLMLTRTLGRDDEHATAQIEAVRIEARAFGALASWLAMNPPAQAVRG